MIDGDLSLSYAELERHANRLAAALRNAGVQPGEPVGVYSERSAALVVGLLALFKAGAACLPLDLAYPPERLAFMLEDAGVRFCLVHVQGPGAAAPGELAERARLLLLDEQGRLYGDAASQFAAQDGDQTDLPALSSGESLGYVIYTSGSTGTPKGICIPQQAVTRMLVNSDYLEIRPQDRLSQAANFSFDAAIFEIWGRS